MSHPLPLHFHRIDLTSRVMGGPIAGMAPGAALPTTPTSQSSSDDLCIDCFRNGEKLVTALLDAAITAKDRYGGGDGGGAGPLFFTGWHDAELLQRRRNSAYSDESSGERRRRHVIGWTAEEAEPFEHHLNIDDYIREYRRHREPRMKRIMRKTIKRDVGNSLLIVERLRLLEDTVKSTETRLFSQRPSDREKENGRVPKQVTVVQLITGDTPLHHHTEDASVNANPNPTLDRLRDCCNIQRVGAVYPREESSSAPVTAHTVPIHLSSSDFLPSYNYACVNGRRIPQLPSRSESPSTSGIILDKAMGTVRRYPKPAPAPPPTAEPKSRSRQQLLGRSPLVLPQISQDLCASFRQENQIEDVKRLKEAKRLRCIERQQQQQEHQQQYHQQQQRQLQQQHYQKLRFDSFETRGLFTSDSQEFNSHRRETATAPSTNAVVHVSVPWSSIVLGRRPRTRPRPLCVTEDGDG